MAFSNHFSSTPDARVGQRTEQSRYGAALAEASAGRRGVRNTRVLFGGDPYVFEGQAQTLDHQFVSRELERDLNEVRVAHVNADWPADFEGDEARGASDHDPVVSRFEFSSGDDD